MTDLEYRRRRAMERILEDESLTADLGDDAAQSLLDWGVAQTKVILEQAKEFAQEELDAHLVNLRRMIKRINRQAGQATPEAQVEQVEALLAEIEAEHDMRVKNVT